MHKFRKINIALHNSFKAFLVQVVQHNSVEALPIQFYQYDKLTEEQKKKW